MGMHDQDGILPNQMLVVNYPEELSNGFRILPCDNAEMYFWHLQNLRQPDPIAPNVLYRGQAKDWPLIANLFRSELYKQASVYMDGIGDPPDEQEEKLISLYKIEEELIDRFKWVLNQVGVNLPESPPNLLNVEYPHADELNEYRLNDESVLPFIALAQHNQIPTRLLDWTYSSLVATYFAAVDAIKKYELSATTDVELEYKRKDIPNFYVYALYTDKIEKSKFGSEDSMNIQIIECPYKDNKYLRAQKGVFTYSLKEYQPVNKLLIDGEYVTRFDIPITQVYSILRILSGFGINGSTVFPGYEGAVKQMKERMFYRFR